MKTISPHDKEVRHGDEEVHRCDKEVRPHDEARQPKAFVQVKLVSPGDERGSS